MGSRRGAGVLVRMRSRALLSLAFALLAPCGAAQAPVAGATRTLLAELTDEHGALQAVRGLVAQGKAVVPLLLATVEERARIADDRACLMAVYAIAKLGDGGAAAARPLLRQLDTATGMLQRQLCWALGEIGPAAA